MQNLHFFCKVPVLLAKTGRFRCIRLLPPPGFSRAERFDLKPPGLQLRAGDTRLPGNAALCRARFIKPLNRCCLILVRILPSMVSRLVPLSWTRVKYPSVRKQGRSPPGASPDNRAMPRRSTRPCPVSGPVRGGSCHSARGKNRLPKGRFNLLPKVFPVILHRKKAVTALDTAIVECIQEQGAGFRSLAEDIDTTAPASRLLFYVMADPRKRPRRNGGTEWTALPTAGWLPPVAAPGVRKSRVLPGGGGSWVSCAALTHFCVAFFLRFVSFQIFVPGNTLTPLINFFPTEI